MPRMVLEVALIDVGPRAETAYRAAYAEARTLVGSSPAAGGAHDAGVETRTRFVLLVEWDSVQAHDGFRSTSASASGAVWSAPTSPTRRRSSASPP